MEKPTVNEPAKSLNSRLKITYRVTFFITFLEGCCLLWVSLRSPSMPQNAIFLGFSAQRLFLAGFLAILTCASFILLIVFQKQTIAIRIDQWIDSLFSNQTIMVRIFYILLTISLSSSFSFLIFYSPLSNNLTNVIHAIFQRVLPANLYLLLLSTQTMVCLLIAKSQKLSKLLSKPTVRNNLILFFIILFSIFQIVFIGTKLSIRELFPSWIWDYWNKDVGLAYGFFPLILVFALMIIYVVRKQPDRQTRNVILLIALGYFLQIAFGFMEGMGIAGIERKINQSIPGEYVSEVCNNPVSMNIVREYDKLYADRFWLGTKPPGYLLTFSWIKRVVEIFAPFSSPDDCLEKLTTTIALIAPLISVITLIPLFIISKHLLDTENAYLTLVLYITTPNFILMTTNMDQFLFPLWSISTVLLMISAIHRSSLFLAFLVGFLIYTDIFFSFSLLPLLVFWFIFLAIGLIARKQMDSGKSLISKAIFSMMGTGFSGLIFWRIFEYNVIQRYQNAMSMHRQLKGYRNNWEQLGQTLLLNNFEFVYWIGIPLFVLILVSTLEVFLSIKKRKTTPILFFNSSLLISYLFLNLFGQTIGEVGRLWLFLNPMFVISACYGLTKIANEKMPKWINWIVLLQLCITVTLFTFQDFR